MRFQPLPLRRNDRKPDPAEATEDRPDTPDRRPIVRWSAGPALATKGWTVALWLLLLSGPLTAGAVFLGIVLRPAEPAAPAVQVAAGLNDSTAAAELGDQAVRAWLTTRRGQEDSMPVPLPDYTGLAKPFQISGLTVAAIQPVDAGVWSITYAVQIVNDKKQSSRQYVQIPVRLGAAGGSVLALPSLVPAPRLDDPSPPRYRQPLLAEGPLGSTVTEFLAAFATEAGGDVSRYVSPDASSRITAVTPAPFSAIKVTNLAAGEELNDEDLPSDGQEAHLSVTALGRTASGQELPLSYALTMRGRDARWEVDQLQLAPTPTAPGGSTAPSATSDASPEPTLPR